METRHDDEYGCEAQAAVVGVGAAMMVFGLFYVLGVDEIKTTMRQMETKAPIETATAKIDPHDIWRFKLETAMTENKKKVDLLTKMMGDMASHKDSGQFATDDALGLSGIEELRNEIAALKEQLEIQGVETQGDRSKNLFQPSQMNLPQAPIYQTSGDGERWSPMIGEFMR